jgi:OOP family OmpA-OmpF porin
MRARIGLFAGSLAVIGLLSGGAHGQARISPRTPQDFITILKPAPTATGQPGIRTRSLAPATGNVAAPAAGTAGSGRVPDLQILFEFNSAELTPQARQKLDTLGAALASDELRPFNFQIAGHTDAIGRPDYNLDLSRRRAETVVSYLVTRWGISEDRLRARGFGMSRLVVPQDGADARNRRVEVETIVPN